MVEASTQAELLRILPQLHDDLAARNMDTLTEHHVSYSFVPANPTTLVEKHLIGLFCERAQPQIWPHRGVVSMALVHQ